MRAALNQDDFRVRRCGERNGADGGYGGHAAWALEALSSRSGKRSIMFHESIISYWLLLSPGWRTIPTPPPLCLGVHYLVFSLYWMQKSLDVCFSPIFLLTPQACKMPYVPGILESMKGTDRDKIPPKAFVEEAKAPQDKEGGTWSCHDSATDCRGSHSSDPAQAALLSKTKSMTYWLLRYVLKSIWNQAISSCLMQNVKSGPPIL